MADEAGGPRWQPKPALAEAELDGERVIWDPESGKVARLDRVGSLAWACLDGQIGLDDLAVELSETFGVTAQTVRADLEPFVARLADLGLLIAAPVRPI